METKKETVQVSATEPVYGGAGNDLQVMSEKDFAIEQYGNLKAEESEIKKKVSEAGKFLKDLMKTLETDNLDNEKYELKLSTSTGTVIDAKDMLQEVGFKIPQESEEIINKLFNVNITEAKRLLGALQLNKIMKPGRTTESLRIKEKK
jgi:hypothetical protein